MKIPIHPRLQNGINFAAKAGPWLAGLLLLFSLRPFTHFDPMTLVMALWWAFVGFLLGVLSTMRLERWLGWAGFVAVVWISYALWKAMKVTPQAVWEYLSSHLSL